MAMKALRTHKKNFYRSSQDFSPLLFAVAAVHMILAVCARAFPCGGYLSEQIANGKKKNKKEQEIKQGRKSKRIILVNEKGHHNLNNIIL